MCFTVSPLKHSARRIRRSFDSFFLFTSDLSTCNSSNRMKSVLVGFCAIFALSLQSDTLFSHLEKTRFFYLIPIFTRE